MKTIKIKFTKGLAGYGLGYIAGQIAEVPEEKALQYLDKGWATLHASNTKSAAPPKKAPEKKKPAPKKK